MERVIALTIKLGGEPGPTWKGLSILGVMGAGPLRGGADRTW